MFARHRTDNPKAYMTNTFNAQHVSERATTPEQIMDAIINKRNKPVNTTLAFDPPQALNAFRDELKQAGARGPMNAYRLNPGGNRPLLDIPFHGSKAIEVRNRQGHQRNPDVKIYHSLGDDPIQATIGIGGIPEEVSSPRGTSYTAVGHLENVRSGRSEQKPYEDWRRIYPGRLPPL